MSVNLLVAQVPVVGEMVAGELGAPEAARQATQESSHEAQLKGREQVQQTERRAGVNSVNEDTPRNQQEQRQARDKKEKPEPEEQTAQEETDSPWSGNIVNMRV